MTNLAIPACRQAGANSFDGLSGLVTNELGRSPTSGEVYVFLNKRRTHLKLLRWEPGGFVQYYKKLEKGTLKPPLTVKNGRMNWEELVFMIEGIKVKKCGQKPRSSLTINTDYTQLIYSIYTNTL